MTAEPGRTAVVAGVRRELVFFYGMAVLALIAVSIIAVVASRSVARTQALHDAERTTERLANLVVSPLFADEQAGDAQARRQLDEAISNRMADGYLTEVTVWDSTGTVLYASEAGEIGEQLEPPAEVTAVIERGAVSSAFEDQPEATEQQYQSDAAGFVEVYVPMEADGLDRLAFEAYYDYARVDEAANALLWQLVPLVLAPLLILQILQSPIPFSLARRVRRHEEERSKLLERALSMSDRERVRFAADLHDGPIQDLSGVAYVLDAISLSVLKAPHPLMLEAQSTVTHAIHSLRRLMIDLYPPDLDSQHLSTTIENLAAPLRERGLQVDIDVTELPELDVDTLTTLYRVVREALANAAEHAQATRLQIALGIGPGASPAGMVVLEVTDNGVGIDPSRLDRRSDGHLGLILLIDRVAYLGGHLTITAAAAGTGTTVRVELPVVGAAADLDDGLSTGATRRRTADHG